MTLSLWLSLVAICMMGAMSPGPSLAVVLKHSIHGSMKNGMLAALSHGVGVGFYAAASLLGLGALMLHFTIDTGWNLIVAALTELSKKRFAFTKSSPWFDKILAVIFIGLAIRVVLMV